MSWLVEEGNMVSTWPDLKCRFVMLSFRPWWMKNADVE